MGIAFYLVDDVLDFDVDCENGGGDNNNSGGGPRKKTGKGTLTDLISGVVTAPFLYDAPLYPDQLNSLIDSKFKVKGEVELVVKYLRQSDRVLRT